MNISLIRSWTLRLLEFSWVRSQAFRLLAVVFLLTLFLITFTSFNFDIEAFRLSVRNALQSVVIIFAIIVALSAVLYTNHISGQRELFLKKINSIRDTSESFFDRYDGVSDDTQELINTAIFPILSTSLEDWESFKVVSELKNFDEELLARIHEIDNSILPRYIIKLDMELEELIILLVSRVVSLLIVNVLRGSILVVVFSMLSLSLAHIVPERIGLDMFVSLMCFVSIIYSFFSVFNILSYLQQQSKHEGIE